MSCAVVYRSEARLEKLPLKGRCSFQFLGDGVVDLPGRAGFVRNDLDENFRS